MSVIPANINKAHILKAIERFDKEGLPDKNADSQYYDISYDGKRYPPKVIVSYANYFVNGLDLDRATFQGGKNSESFKKLKTLGFTIVDKNNNLDLIFEYVDYCKKTNWINNEKYKWKFSQWLKERVDFKKQTDEEILKVFIDSQEQRYYSNSQAKGVNFIKSGQQYSDSFVTIDDIRFMRELLSDEWDEKKPNLKHDSTYPKLSVWLSSVDPRKFKPYANSDLYNGLKYLFKLDDNYPKKGLKAFLFAMNKISVLEKDLRKNKELKLLFQEHLETKELTDLDWAWIAQDYVLFATRVLSVPKGDEDIVPLTKNSKYWILAPGQNANKWDEFVEHSIAAIGWDNLEDLNMYNSKDEIADELRLLNDTNISFKNDSLACHEFSKVIKPGDVIIPKRGNRTYLGYGIVQDGYTYDNNRDDYKHTLSVKWMVTGTFEETEHPIVLKTLTDITKYPEYVERLKNLIGIEADIFEPYIKPYSKKDALNDLFIEEDEYENIVELLRYKKNLILQGPPGVGKSYATARIAYSMMGEIDKRRIETVQFHQSYAYEDFIRGYRPDGEGKLKPVDGIFLKFCDMARKDLENDYFFIIDEINRGNLSKIFGELMFLIEKDKRGLSVKLAYDNPDNPNDGFSIPENIFIIGTMNTADRSLAMVDYALRRRFVFYPLEPQFSSKKFQKYLVKNKVSKNLMKKIVDRLTALNETIEGDQKYLGSGYKIGHSYFCPDSDIDKPNDNWYERIIKFEIRPLLNEYWFDDLEKSENEIENLF